MIDAWTDRLSEYLDDELEPAEREALEAHLRHCVACGAVLADFKRIVGRARALEDRAPGSDPWAAIASRIGLDPGAHPAPRGRGTVPLRRWSFSMPQLAAAGIALAAFSGGTAWVLHPEAQSPIVAVQPSPSASPAVPAAVGTQARGYDVAIADLERVLDEGRQRLDTATVRVLERNLAVIDSAIAEAGRAVAADSASLYLNSHLAATMRRKLELLRQAAALVSSVS